jgi:hypothetical protein
VAVTYSTAVKNTRLDAVTTAAGTTAVLEICTTGYSTILATFPLDNPIAAGAASGVLTLSGFPKTDSVPDNNGTAALARIRTASGGTTILDGLTVGTSGTDVILSSTTISTAVPVTLNSATITHG